MTFYEQELKKLFGDSDVIRDAKYSGKTLRRYVYTVTNYPAADGGPYYATVLVYKNEGAGGDVCSAAQNGVMHSFTMPS